MIVSLAKGSLTKNSTPEVYFFFFFSNRKGSG